MARLRVEDRERVRAYLARSFRGLGAERVDAARVLRAEWRLAEEPGELARPAEARGSGRSPGTLGPLSPFTSYD
jgi:hypothetical protein